MPSTRHTQACVFKNITAKLVLFICHKVTNNIPNQVWTSDKGSFGHTGRIPSGNGGSC